MGYGGVARVQARPAKLTHTSSTLVTASVWKMSGWSRTTSRKRLGVKASGVRFSHLPLVGVGGVTERLTCSVANRRPGVILRVFESPYLRAFCFCTVMLVWRNGIRVWLKPRFR